MLPRALGIGLGGLALMALGAGTARSPGAKLESGRPAPPPETTAFKMAGAICPPMTLPDDSVCVHWPDHDGDDIAGESRFDGDRVAPRDYRDLQDSLPRRPDRPADYGAYRYPVPCDGCVVTEGSPSRSAMPGADLDRSDGVRPSGLSYNGRDGIDLSVPSGTPVTVPALEHQQGPAELVYVGQLLGASVVTRHAVREADEERDYIVVLGHLDAAPGLADSGARSAIRLHAGQRIGSAVGRGSSGFANVHLEVRRVRRGVDVRGLQPSALIHGASTIACDPRNVLPLK